jgi:glucan biosynthesis protein
MFSSVNRQSIGFPSSSQHDDHKAVAFLYTLKSGKQTDIVINASMINASRILRLTAAPVVAAFIIGTAESRSRQSVRGY